MSAHRSHKKNLIISYKNLSEDLKELFKNAYPDGYENFIQRTTKPNGDPLFIVPLETEDTYYMVKFDVKIDTGLVEEDIDKDMYGDEKEDDGEFAPLSEAIDKEEGQSHGVGTIRTGAYEDFETMAGVDKKEFAKVAADLEEEFGKDDDEDFDSYVDEETGESEDDDPDDSDEPSDEDLLDLEMELDGIEIPTDGSLLRGPDEEPLAPAPKKRGRPSKAMLAEREKNPEPPKPKATRGRPRKDAKK